MSKSPTPNVTIRPARLDDAAGIAVVRNAAIRDSLALWTTTTLSDTQTRQWLQPAVERQTALVAVQDDDEETQIAGFAVATPWRSYDGYAHTVEDSVYVLDGFAGQGIGSRLLQGLLVAATAAGDRTVVAAIEASNQHSIFLHKQYGFREAGTIPQAGEKYGKVLDLCLLYRHLY